MMEQFLSNTAKPPTGSLGIFHFSLWEKVLSWWPCGFVICQGRIIKCRVKPLSDHRAKKKIYHSPLHIFFFMSGNRHHRCRDNWQKEDYLCDLAFLSFLRPEIFFFFFFFVTKILNERLLVWLCRNVFFPLWLCTYLLYYFLGSIYSLVPQFIHLALLQFMHVLETHRLACLGISQQWKQEMFLRIASFSVIEQCARARCRSWRPYRYEASIFR